MSRRQRWIGSALLGGLGLTLLYLDANLIILGQKGMGQLAFAGTPIKVLWVGAAALILSALLVLYPSSRHK